MAYLLYFTNKSCAVFESWNAVSIILILTPNSITFNWWIARKSWGLQFKPVTWSICRMKDIKIELDYVNNKVWSKLD